MKKHRHWNWHFHLNLNLKTKKAVAVVAIALVIALLAGAGLYLLFQHKVRNTLSDVSEVPVTESPYVTKDGIKYVRDTSVKSYLFLGVDDVGLNYENYGRGGRTDTILLLIRKGNDLRILEISRDTMTEVDTYDTSGEYLSSGVMQLNMQYSFGDSPRRSAYLTKRTVSELLGNVRIDGAVSLDMSGIAPIVNEMGGIDVLMEEDCTYIDPAYRIEETVHMTGSEAEHFIRWRDKTADGSNDARMSRHTWFIRQILEKMKENGLSRLLSASESYVNTDLTAEEMNGLFKCELKETVRLPGETKQGDRHEEFYVDEDKLTDLRIRLFYLPA